MFEIERKVQFLLMWDFDLAANPGCAGFHIKMTNSVGTEVSGTNLDRNARKANQVCNAAGVHTITVCAVDSKGVEGAMGTVQVKSVEKGAPPVVPPVAPNPTGKLPAPTNVRVERLQ